MDPGQGAILSDIDLNWNFTGDTDPQLCQPSPSPSLGLQCVQLADCTGCTVQTVQGVQSAVRAPVLRLRGCLCPSQPHVPAPDPASAGGPPAPSRSPVPDFPEPRSRGLSSSHLEPPLPTELAASRHAVNATRGHLSVQ